jgi:acetylornithine deacetylase
LQEAGFDVQTLGFGKLAAYHSNNEYGLLSDFKKGYKVLAVLTDKYNATYF